MADKRLIDSPIFATAVSTFAVVAMTACAGTAEPAKPNSGLNAAALSTIEESRREQAKEAGLSQEMIDRGCFVIEGQAGEAPEAEEGTQATKYQVVCPEVSQ